MSSCTYTVYGELDCSSNLIELDSDKPIQLDNKQNTESVIQPFDSSASNYGALNASNESGLYKNRCMNNTQ